MEQHLVVFKLLFLTIILVNIVSATAMDSPITEYTAQEGVSDFTTSFYKALKEDHPTNLISSPFSISMLMALLKVAARGKTAQEIQVAFKFPEKDNDLLKGWSSLLSSLKVNRRAILSAANKVYLQDGFSLSKEFSASAQNYFKGAVEQLDFSNSMNSATSINDWVAKHTGDKIKNLFSLDAFDSLTSIVLVNAIYFRGSWLNKFDAHLTEKKEFSVSVNEKVQVDMMMQSQRFPYANLQDLDAQLIALPFKGKKLSMLILLPNNVNGIRALEEKLSSVSILKLCTHLRVTKVELSLPKFSLELELDLKKTLIKMGITSIFDRSVADFGGLSESKEQLSVSEVIQKAFIEINEEGAEAAAATGAHVKIRSISYPVEFNADHPFIYSIVLHDEENFDSQNSTILFYGSLFKPAETPMNRDEL